MTPKQAKRLLEVEYLVLEYEVVRDSNQPIPLVARANIRKWRRELEQLRSLAQGPAGMTIEFDDAGPDKEDKRRFTLTWPVEPRVEGFPNDPVLVTRRGQCFNSAQWREFLAKGALDVTKTSPHSETKSWPSRS